MEFDPNHLAPCGLYCGVCGVLVATRDNNVKFKEKLVGVYRGSLPGSENLSAEDIHCGGCLSDRPFLFCRICGIKRCTQEKGHAGCHECGDFPCEMIEQFPVPVGKRVILRTIPHWRETGTARFVRDEEARYTCPQCGHSLFRGARRCNQCKVEVDLD